MAINWPNLSPKTKAFTKPAAYQPQSNYTGVPAFQQTAGVLPGQAPKTGHTVAPTYPDDPKGLLAGFPGPRGIGTVTIGH